MARRTAQLRVTAVDAAASMLEIARTNIAAARLDRRIDPVLADAKHLPFADGSFPAVISNSILHHIAEPRFVVTEAIRVTESDGLLFHRDLARPNDEAELKHLLDAYAGTCTDYQRRLFGESLRAALAIDEVRDLVGDFGFAADTVQMSSDRHWTWIARND